jgi:CheY-like chemotaxis protein
MPRSGTQILKRILIADDDPTNRCWLGSLVTNEGYAAVEVNNGNEAFKILQADANFAAAILNITMPGLGGIDLTGYMKTEKRLQRIPVMLITGERDLKLLANSFSAGALAFLHKPFTAEQLQNAFRVLTPCATGITCGA